jgi:hypothetical protein
MVSFQYPLHVIRKKEMEQPPIDPSLPLGDTFTKLSQATKKTIIDEKMAQVVPTIEKELITHFTRQVKYASSVKQANLIPPRLTFTFERLGLYQGDYEVANAIAKHIKDKHKLQVDVLKKDQLPPASLRPLVSKHTEDCLSFAWS